MTKFFAIALAATTLAGAPAAAQTYDAFSSFNASQGAGHFFYGDLVSPNQFSEYTATTDCFIDGAICLQRNANHDVPGVEKGGSPAFQYGSVNVPQDRLLVHPANDTSLVSTLFLTPTTGDYRLTATFNVQDINPSGVDLFELTAPGNNYPVAEALIGSLSSASPSFTYTTTLHLNASDIVGFGVGNGGVYYNDSTGFNFSVAAVPEPATWAMMLAGFAMVGFGLRYRRKGQGAKVSFA